MTTTDLYPYLIIIGASILLAAAWLLHQYRTQLLRTQELILLNEQLAYDLPDFLRQCWPILKDSGFSGLEWQLNWFGTRLSGTEGNPTLNLIEKHLEVKEIKLSIKLYRKKSGLEQQYFSSAQAENFFLLVRMNLWIKLGTVQGAFDQTAKMTVFLKHDVKNMVQLLSLSSDQLSQISPGQEATIIPSLKEVIPAVKDRAEHMLRALNDKSGRMVANPSRQEQLELGKVLSQTASLYDLDIDISGEATICIDRDQLLSIIDNLLGNYSRQARKAGALRPLLMIRIDNSQPDVTITFQDTLGTPFPWPERLFEPFWSEHGDGRGIGLYQSRQQAIVAGGYLDAFASDKTPIIFTLTLPATENNDM